MENTPIFGWHHPLARRFLALTWLATTKKGDSNELTSNWPLNNRVLFCSKRIHFLMLSIMNETLLRNYSNTRNIWSPLWALMTWGFSNSTSLTTTLPSHSWFPDVYGLIGRVAQCLPVCMPCCDGQIQFSSRVGVTYQSKFKILRRRQDGRHFPDDIFECIFFNENV